ncbi:MARVEL domain-containing protein [Plasmodiophora brassicae]
MIDVCSNGSLARGAFLAVFWAYFVGSVVAVTFVPIEIGAYMFLEADFASLYLASSLLLNWAVVSAFWCICSAVLSIRLDSFDRSIALWSISSYASISSGLVIMLAILANNDGDVIASLLYVIAFFANLILIAFLAALLRQTFHRGR